MWINRIGLKLVHKFGLPCALRRISKKWPSQKIIEKASRR